MPEYLEIKPVVWKSGPFTLELGWSQILPVSVGVKNRHQRREVG